MTEIKWEAPPVTARGAGGNREQQQFADALRSRPNEWALYSDDTPASTVTNINKGQLKAFRPAGAFAATSRMKPSSRRAAVWVRYVGGDE